MMRQRFESGFGDSTGRSCAQCLRGYAAMRLSSGNLTQKRPKIFHLNSVPRQKAQFSDL